MPEKFKETPQNFYEFISLNRPMSSQEAIEKLCSFLKTTPEIILEEFMNLRNFDEGAVIFRESVNSGYPCIVMEGLDQNGQHVWDHLIDKYFGKPMSRTS